MINPSDVVKLRMPHPDTSAVLATKTHMYVCAKKEGTNKFLLSCQTFKPQHALKRVPKVILKIDSSENGHPFKVPTTISCDTYFKIENAILPNTLLCNPATLSTDIFSRLKQSLKHGPSVTTINTQWLFQVNSEVKKHNSLK
ncbi:MULTISPECIES: hypothetical protein [unclassified Exiguobacterium]|uniref:hypothetical protein n=1 Tax=unclassified Exiguobacterium TaxID=2644629 RepID=UPI001BE5863B|nr:MULTISPECIES: hypothetical protein [unclassified Exiguobacterium]